MLFNWQLHPIHRFRSTPRVSKAIGAAAILLVSAAPAFAQGTGSPSGTPTLFRTDIQEGAQVLKAVLRNVQQFAEQEVHNPWLWFRD